MRAIQDFPISMVERNAAILSKVEPGAVAVRAPICKGQNGIGGGM
jgi:hypothetical protein